MIADPVKRAATDVTGTNLGRYVLRLGFEFQVLSRFRFQSVVGLGCAKSNSFLLSHVAKRAVQRNGGHLSGDPFS